MHLVASIVSALRERLQGEVASLGVDSYTCHPWKLSCSSAALDRLGRHCLFRTRLGDDQPNSNEPEDHAGRERGGHEEYGPTEDTAADIDEPLPLCNDWLTINWIEVHRIDPDDGSIVGRHIILGPLDGGVLGFAVEEDRTEPAETDRQLTSSLEDTAGASGAASFAEQRKMFAAKCLRPDPITLSDMGFQDLGPEPPSVRVDRPAPMQGMVRSFVNIV